MGDIAHVSFDRIYFGTGLNVILGENTEFNGRVDVKAFNEFPRLANPGGTRRFYYYFYLHQAELKHKFMSFLNNEKLQLDVGGGYFPYKYNPDVRNLGEHLFRSTVYPQTLTTEFDMPWARVAGLYGKMSYTSGKNIFGLDVLANLNTEWMAIGDLNLTFIAKYNFAQLLEIGAGVQLSSLVSTDASTTTPVDIQTNYVKGNDTTNNYTFKGTKVMGRLALDPKKFISFPFLYKNDLKIYSEATLLGTKNYGVAFHSPIWYNSIKERIPVAVGMNWPTHQFASYCLIPEVMAYILEPVKDKKIASSSIMGATGIICGIGSWLLDRKLLTNTKLDVLSIEAEWWGNRYPNSMEGVVIEGLPLPFLKSTKSIDSAAYQDDNIKWSIYGEKTFKTHYRLSFQIASDHMRTFAWDYQRQDWEESLHGPNKWSYVLKFGILF